MKSGDRTLIKRIKVAIHDHSLMFVMFRNYAVVMVIFALLTGILFIQMFSRIITNSNKSQLEKQASRIANRVSEFVQDDDYITYPSFLEVLEETEANDVWIISNPSNPMKSAYANVSLSSAQRNEVAGLLSKIYSGKAASTAKYSRTYEGNYVFAGAPIKNVKGDVVGAVLFNQKEETEQAILQQGIRTVTMSALLALLVSGIIAIFFARSLTRPILKMRKTALKLAEGDYSAKTGIRSKGELGDLARAIDILSERLKRAEEQRKKLDQMRIDFFANVSHELRTPITVVRAYTETLADGVVDDEETRQEYYDKMLSEMQSMERLVGDLLVLSKMQNPDFQIEREPINLVQVFDDIDRSANALAKQKNLTVNRSCPKDVLLMYGDYDRIRQMFMVIIDNAVKFSNEGGEIDISIEEVDGRPHSKDCDPVGTKYDMDGDIYEIRDKKLVTKIRDHGVGISDQELPNIFDKFYKSKLRQNAKGSGLGLAIARQIAVKHGGTISVASKVGEGTQFTFEFAEIFPTET